MQLSNLYAEQDELMARARRIGETIDVPRGLAKLYREQAKLLRRAAEIAETLAAIAARDARRAAPRP